MADELKDAIAQRIEALGYELVELERAGSRARPILRLRVDLEGGTSADPGTPGVTVEDCTRVSRAVEEYLDNEGEIAERYVLEVSSPGVERPLVRDRDFERFAGREVLVKTTRKLPGGSSRVEGKLLGLAAADGEQVVRIRQADGTELEIPRADVSRAHLIFRWKDRQ
jgi:ribosome maturation factor RimP